MDWEYQNRGPFDPTSPFAQAAQSGGLQHGKIAFPNVLAVSLQLADRYSGFASPTRPSASSRPNPFATPSKPQPNRPLFTPQNNSAKPPAPPFRNPSFTTPRKPFDEVVLSEASGAEDSPARTEASDLPNDTPEADRMSDVFVSGAITPGKVDKSHRYQKGGLSARKHASGKGDIRPYRDFGASDLGRRRRRRDRNIHMQRHYQDWDEDSDDSLYDRSRYRSRHKKSNAPPRNGGVIGSIFHMMEEHHTAPENLHRWIQLGINIFLGGIFCVAIFSVVHAVHADIVAVNELARQEIRTDIARCQDLYLSNGCATTDAPAFKALCTEWYECMSQDPERIVRVRTTLKEVAHIMNDFFGNLNLKAWVSLESEPLNIHGIQC